MDKYEYNDKIYCDDDLSEEIDNYGGDIHDLYLELKSDRKADEFTYYCSTDGSNQTYENYEEMIDEEFPDLRMDGGNEEDTEDEQ